MGAHSGRGHGLLTRSMGGHVHFPVNEMGAVSTQLKEDVVFDLIISLLGMYPKCCHGYTQMSVSTHPVEGAVPETGKQEAA